MSTTKLQHNSVFVMEGSTLTVKMNGLQKGWAALVIKEDQLLSEDGYSTVEYSPSDLRDLRDFLNKLAI